MAASNTPDAEPKRVLFVVTAADRWTLKDGTVHPSGYWGEELAMPHKIFSEAGWNITLATPGGKAPTLDRLSMNWTAGSSSKRHAIADYLLSIKPQLDHPRSLGTVNPDDYDLVFYPGGHGPMEDLAYDEVSGALLTRRLNSGRPLALLCHAPAAALAARNPDGSWPFEGYRMTGLSNTEERLNTFGWKAKWFLEDRLREEGAEYVKGAIPLLPFLVVDRNLYTGQNPASSEQLAKRLVADLS
ncbi:type 1 glutamine amidotransferase domain-containing protein (plasmid) [Deinococcus metallilatus]|uniref:Intracellular protease/amidase n=1 Tax=Deinococcus metallilatus TaxID=1211322 RepID=A0ABR6N146_9DEIO|nr:type 1 glutamine amidotransferase domain-containing protein [Deinococcus metallilatus]MBB5296937.1 putative intracellular protease/amidase [Deinococcus metallilatus]QBY06695.1 type 1 glutamine amidotransferase domain-containing protein [Deinococcus metallilatus]GMA15164.1 dimethylallyltransferase [Deinococcus metallilatus]